MTTKTKVFGTLVLLLTVFLLGFVPQYIAKRSMQEHVQELTATTSSLQRSLQLSDLQGIAGMMLVEVSRQNYGLASEHSSRYFLKLGALLDEMPETELKTALEQLASERDSITASLAQADTTSANKVQELLVRTNTVAERFRQLTK